MTARAGFLGPAILARPNYLGQITDPVILAKVDLAESYANAIKTVAQVVQVDLKAMVASSGGARETFKSLLKNPTFSGYVMKLLVLSAVIVKENIRALQLTPQELANVLLGAQEAVKEVYSDAEIESKLKTYEDEIVARAPTNIQAEVRRLIDGSGITPSNLAPNLPEGSVAEPEATAPSGSGLSGLEMAALIGIPLVVLTGVGLIWKS